MAILSKVRQIFRGDVNARTAAAEALRRVNVEREQRRERASLATLDQQPARLREEFARVRASDLLAHFRSRTRPKFFPGFDDLNHTAPLQQQLFPDETAQLLNDAQRVTRDHCWPLLGFGEKCFGHDEVNWNRDPLSGFQWPLDYHADINLFRNDGSDARVTWEFNRLAHLITLGRAFAVSEDEQFSTEFFRQVESWRRQNPVGCGVNWNCAMEVALRAMNLLAAFTLFLRAPQMDEIGLKQLLQMFDQHGAHIERNLEFSHIATSNHYLSDVVGLLWIGVMLPELEKAAEWREFGLRELLNEMDKQILPDGADYEASTGYHRLKVELWLYSFVLCHSNGFAIDEKYWNKLRAMCEYMRAVVRPDGYAPLIGDSDSGQVLPIVKRRADDHAYVLAVAAAVFHEPRFKLGTHTSGGHHAAGAPGAPEELLWLLGERGANDYESLSASGPPESQAFSDAGIVITRADDHYLLFNASGCGVNGRGSHGHNDALSVEVSACGSAFIVDPGSYVYTHDLHERHLFRSTAYHSTVQVDDVEQNSTNEQTPFVIGDEAHPRVLTWETNDEIDRIAAEHNGYRRLSQPVTHCRVVQLNKPKRFWKITDALHGEGEHRFCFRFVFAPHIEPVLRADGVVQLCDKMTGVRLFLVPIDRDERPDFVPGWISRDYGAKTETFTACWSIDARAPLIVRWALVPVCNDDDEAARLELIGQLRGETSAEIRFGVFGRLD